VQVAVNLYESFLQEVLGVVGVVGVPEANGVHFTGKPVIQFFLHLPVSLYASID
jgi:hypothetical protein